MELERTNSSNLDVQTHFGRLLSQLKLELAERPVTLERSRSDAAPKAPLLLRTVTAPARFNLAPNQEANMNLVLNALLPRENSNLGAPGVMKLMREVSKSAMLVAHEVDEVEDGVNKEAFEKAMDPDVFEPKPNTSLPEETPSKEELQKAAGKSSVKGSCVLCCEESDLLVLVCQHTFCAQCLSQQLEARWPSVRVVFTYLLCAFCRSPLEHEELGEKMEEHKKFHQRVVEIATAKFREDGLHEELEKELGHAPTDEEVNSRAEEKMAIFMCNDCKEPYCGGRVDCAALADVKAADLKCHECEWSGLAGENDRRCMKHGHRHAIFKCDSCCNVAIWNCGSNRYCDRCHDIPCDPKHFPCPGPEKCPLGMPHPKNVEAVLGGDNFKSFVVGCSACVAFADDFAAPKEKKKKEPDDYDYDYDYDEDAAYNDLDEQNRFGYGEGLDWDKFANAQDMLDKVGEKEIMERCRAKYPQLQPDLKVLDCADALLKLEKGEIEIFPLDMIFPKRDWLSFSSGGSVLAEASEPEIRHRLKLAHKSELNEDSIKECAERLLLLEQGFASIEALVANVEKPSLVERLKAVGLPTNGPAGLLAQRLLRLRAQSIHAMPPEPPPQAFDLEVVDLKYETMQVRFEACSLHHDGQAIVYVVFAIPGNAEEAAAPHCLVEVIGVNGPVEASLDNLAGNTKYSVGVVTLVRSAVDFSHRSYDGRGQRTLAIPKDGACQVPPGTQCAPMTVTTLSPDVAFSKIEVNVSDPSQGKDAVKSAFNMFDLNGDGFIDTDELQRVMRVLDPEYWTDRKLAQLMAAADPSPEGKIGLDTFYTWITGDLQDAYEESFSPPPISGEVSLEWSGLQLGPHWHITLNREAALEDEPREFRMRMATSGDPCTHFTALPCGAYRIEVKTAMPGRQHKSAPRTGRCWVFVGSHDLSNMEKRLQEVCGVGSVKTFGDRALAEEVFPA
mmetsp:Transcript_74156/g.141195  ORF Transcript_74156/g.141195 Transcript_74156/m.141195 type:complete len:955 (+) Transcript_74156:168-3032(+)